MNLVVILLLLAPFLGQIPISRLDGSRSVASAVVDTTAAGDSFTSDVTVTTNGQRVSCKYLLSANCLFKPLFSPLQLLVQRPLHFLCLPAQLAPEVLMASHA